MAICDVLSMQTIGGDFVMNNLATWLPIALLVLVVLGLGTLATLVALALLKYIRSEGH